MNFADLQRLQRGLHRISFDEFAQALQESIGANRDYAQGVWVSFQDWPVWYMTSRRPEVQGKRLFELAWVKGQEGAPPKKPCKNHCPDCGKPKRRPGPCRDCSNERRFR